MFFKKLISYFYPIIIQKYSSKYNGVLELSLQNGQLVVDAKNANYSYGSLHKLFRKVIDEFTFEEGKKEVLILGFGAGSIATILCKEQKIDCRIDGVEIDNVMLQIYNEYFKIKDVELQVFTQDAILYLTNCKKKYDYIFIDLFSDLKVPDKFTQQNFLNLVKKVSKPSTQIAMNTINNSQFEQIWVETFGNKAYSRFYYGLNTILYKI
ncbi:MAG: fused MFS/spermidine synthase [Chitinophagales bacterium]